jgi:hypothetical protein
MAAAACSKSEVLDCSVNAAVCSTFKKKYLLVKVFD